MGSSYTNFTLQGVTQSSVTAGLAGRSAAVTLEQNGCVVVFDEESDEMDPSVSAHLAADLSRRLWCSVLAMTNQDDDILIYELYRSGELVDEYNSAPDYFDPDAESSAPEGGDAEQLCDAFGAADSESVTLVLRMTMDDADAYSFASQRHSALVRALGLPRIAIARGYADVRDGERPEGWTLAMFAMVKVPRH